MELKFFKCRICGKIIAVVKETGVPTICCGEEMMELKAGMTDGAVEKHVPAVKVSECSVEVQVGSTAHPMEEKHYIEWIALLTDQGLQMKFLHPGNKPEAVFPLSKNEKFVKAYEYCNIHGLWEKC